MNCSDHHDMSVGYSSWSHMDELNNALDPITILTDADLQNELSLYATTQFTYDGLPNNMPTENKSTIPNHFNIHPPPLSLGHSGHPPTNLVINTTTIKNNDLCSSTISSPNDPQQHYFTPIPSLPTSPLLNDLGDYTNPMLSLMLSPPPTVHHHPCNLVMQDPSHAHYMNRSVSIDTDMMLNTTHDFSPTTRMPCTNHRSVTRRRTGSTGAHRGRPRRQQQQQQQHDYHTLPLSTAPTQQILVDDKHDDDDDDDDDESNMTMGPFPNAPVHNNNHANSLDLDENSTTTTKQQQPEEEVRLSKRQRNTAASARFRIKKKLREQSLQRTACEMTNKANFMENKVHELEREIRWLKALLMAKNGCNHF